MDCDPLPVQLLVSPHCALCDLSELRSVNAHAEELRKSFVAHEGKKKLVVYASGTRYTVDFGDMARQMTDLIDANVGD
jgi:Domain of unknown function (DUF4419)